MLFRSPLLMAYESLVEIPLRYQVTGNEADKDILTSLRGFQIKSYVKVAGMSLPNSKKLKVMFQSVQAQIIDRYDWNYSEYLTVPNPDFNSKLPNAVAPTEKTIQVYHTNAKRLEDAGLAKPYDVLSKPWEVTEAQFHASEVIDPNIKL